MIFRTCFVVIVISVSTFGQALWSIHPQPLPTRILNGITYGNNIYIAVGDSGTIVTSPDGTNWTRQTSNINGDIEGITFGNGLFVAITTRGIILTSSQGTSWSVDSSNIYRYSSYYSITYGNNTFAAITAGSFADTILSSANGTSWSKHSRTRTGGLWPAITFINNQFVTIPDLATSQNATNWTTRSLPTNVKHITSITFGINMYVALGDSIYTSPDLTTWATHYVQTKTLNGWSLNSSIVFGNNTFVASGNGTVVSTNGTSWIESDSVINRQSRFESIQATHLVYGNNLFVATGTDANGAANLLNNILTSPTSSALAHLYSRPTQFHTLSNLHQFTCDGRVISAHPISRWTRLFFKLKP